MSDDVVDLLLNGDSSVTANFIYPLIAKWITHISNKIYLTSQEEWKEHY